jgi:hypothetical protein
MSRRCSASTIVLQAKAHPFAQYQPQERVPSTARSRKKRVENGAGCYSPKVRCFPLILALVACGKSEPAPAPTPSPTKIPAPVADPPPVAKKTAVDQVIEKATECEKLPFAESTPVPEASGAGWLEIDGALALVVVSDSGNDGKYGIVDPETGKTREEGKLPLGKAGEDIEGVAAKDGLLYGVTSSGWMRVWKRAGKGFELVQDAYPLGAAVPREQAAIRRASVRGLRRLARGWSSLLLGAGR